MPMAGIRQASLLRTLGIVCIVAVLPDTVGDPCRVLGAEATCATCHPEQAAQLADSVHARSELSCISCHGGAPTYEVAPPDLTATTFDHGPSFNGRVDRLAIPDTCGGCHSDVALMNPYGLPADQLQRYKTSGHGLAVYERHNTDAAVCTDCHDIHAIHRSSDSRSWTHPLNVPSTCGRCHGDPRMMARYGHSSEIMVEYRNSVHGRGLLEDHDTAMPTCATCHGNHAAMPPGIETIHAVCGRCHSQAETFFLQSPHAELDVFPRCLACHGGPHSHATARLTVKPQSLAAAYGRLGEDLDEAAFAAALHPGLSLITETCYECHDEDSDDDSDVTALQRSGQLFELISRSELAYATTHNRVERVGRGVLLVEDEALTLGEARTALIELSSRQHSLDLETVGEVAERAATATTHINESLDAKQRGLAWRRQVLLPMWIFILIFGVASYIKYRQLRERYVKHPDAGPGRTVSDAR